MLGCSQSRERVIEMSETVASRVSTIDPRTIMLYDANKKSAGIAYLLWFFVGLLGGHRFYLGRTGSGLGMAALLVLSLILTVAVIGVFGLFVLGIWALIDALLIPGMVQEHNNQLIQRLGS